MADTEYQDARPLADPRAESEAERDRLATENEKLRRITQKLTPEHLGRIMAEIGSED